MSNFTDFFPAAGGGGGGIPKYQEFTSSGTFTPTQALIDAGGRLGLFIVAGGGGGWSTSQGLGSVATGGAGGEVLNQYVTLTSTNSITVTIGNGGVDGNPGTVGGNTTFAASSAGASDIIALGGTAGVNSNQTPKTDNLQTSGFGGIQNGSGTSAAGSGTLGYGVGGGTFYGSGINVPKPNSGSGGGAGQDGGSGFVRITWFE